MWDDSCCKCSYTPVVISFKACSRSLCGMRIHNWSAAPHHVGSMWYILVSNGFHYITLSSTYRDTTGHCIYRPINTRMVIAYWAPVALRTCSHPIYHALYRHIAERCIMQSNFTKFQTVFHALHAHWHHAENDNTKSNAMDTSSKTHDQFRYSLEGFFNPHA